MEINMYRECWSVILVLLVQNILTSEAIQCYRCAFATYIYYSNDTFLCKDLDYSDKFIVDCPFSTFCVKKNTYAKINGVQINGTERDCASQKLDTQELKNGKWHGLTRIEEPYSEGCKSDEDKGQRTAYVEHCYCRGHLCNSGNNVYKFESVSYVTSVLSLLVIHLIVTFL